MDAKDIMNDVLNYLDMSPKAFSEALGRDRPQAIYDILKGKTKSISQALANQILSVFPCFDKYWLLTGEGDMLISPQVYSSNEKESLHAELIDDIEVYEKAIRSGLSLIPEKDVFFRGGTKGEVNDSEPVIGYWHIPNAPQSSVVVSIDGDSMEPVLPSGARIMIAPFSFDKDNPVGIPFGNIFGIVLEDRDTGVFNCYIKYLRRHTDPKKERKYWIARSENRNKYDDFDVDISCVKSLWLVDYIIKKIR